MPTTIEVNKQSVEALLGSGKSKPFVIPEYQRPYAWTDEQVETLFEDLWDFTATSGGTERESSYFLGSVVSYENEDGEQEIIDGQQRITSLFLLLRAIYTKLVATPASERTAEANNFTIICFIIAHWIRIRRRLLLASGSIMRLISLSACISLNCWTLFLLS